MIIVLCALALVACASKTPLEKMLASRAMYKATLNSFFVKETPLVDPTVAAAEEGEEGEAAEAPAADEEGMEEEMAPPAVRLDAVLDVIVQHDTNDPLPGVTLDISMVDDAQVEIAHWRYFADTTGLPKANQRPFSIVFEDVPYQEGYGFHVEVRRPVPDADRGDYREFEGL